MSLIGRKISAFIKKVADLPDRPSPSYSAPEIKSYFDSPPEELRVAHNGLIDDLTSVTPGSSGAEQIGSAPIAGVAGASPYAQISDLKAQHDSSKAVTDANKTKLDTIQTGAEENQNAFSKIAVPGQSNIDSSSKIDTLNIAGGTGITITTNPATETITITATGSATPGAHAASHVTGGTDVIPNAVSGGNAGLMSGTDKSNLDAVSQKGGPSGVTGGTGAAYTVTASPALAALVDHAIVAVKWHTDNTGACTINVNGLGAKAIKKSNGNDPAAANLKANAIATLRYSSTANGGAGAFILQGEGGGGNATAADLLAGKTASTDVGDIVGTMVDRGAPTFNPGTADQSISAGRYTGGTVKGDANLIAPNILSGKSIFGVAGSLTPGKRFATGTISYGGSGALIVTGLAFAPTKAFLWFNGGATNVTEMINLSSTADFQVNGGARYGIKLNINGGSTSLNFDSTNVLTSDGFSVVPNSPAAYSGNWVYWAYE